MDSQFINGFEIAIESVVLSNQSIKHMAFRLLIILVFDGHVWNMKLLDPDVFTSFSLAAMTELPAAILLALFLDRWGRRWMGFASMFLCGVFSLIALATPPGRLTIMSTIIITVFLARERERESESSYCEITLQSDNKV